MAVENSNSGQVQEFLDLLRRRWGQLLLPVLFAGAIAFLLATVLPRTYLVSTKVAMREKELPFTAAASDINRDVFAANNEVKTARRVEEVLKALDLPDFMSLGAADRRDYIDDVLGRLTARVITNQKNAVGTSYIIATYSDTDPQRAARFLNLLRDSYTEEVVQRRLDDAKEQREKLKDLVEERRQVFADIEQRIAELQKSKGLSSTQPAPGRGVQRLEDPVALDLNQKRQLLNEAKLDLKTKESLREQLRRVYEDEPEQEAVTRVIPGVDVSAEVKQLEAEIQTWRKKQDGLKRENSTYQRADAEIRILEERLAETLARAVPDTEEIEYVPSKRRSQLSRDIADLGVQIATLETRISLLTIDIKDLDARQREQKTTYAELNQLDQERINARTDYEDSNQRYQRMRDTVTMLEGPEANPFAVIEPAEANNAPMSPNVPVIYGVSILIGLGLGLATALASEYLRNGFRSAGDIARGLAVPVLGSINSIVTRAEARRNLARRAAVGGASLVAIATIVWITWAYANRPALLGADLHQLINDVRDRLR